MPAGLKTSRGGYRHPLYSRTRRAKPPVVWPSADETAARKDAANRDTERFLALLADRQARIAVEGDTDLNHDNVEAAE